MALSRNDQLSRVWSYLDDDTRKAYQEGEITDDDLLRVGLQQGWISADFSDVSGQSSTVPVAPSIMETLSPLYTEPREAMANINLAARGGLNRMAGAQLFSAADQGAEVPSEVIRSLIGGADLTEGGFVFDALSRATGQDLITGQPREDTRDMGRRLYEQGSEETKTARDRTGNWFTRGAVDVAGSPSSLASLIGGPAAAVGGADVFAQEYTSARLAGLPEEEARARALGQAGAETALSVIPSGKLLGLGGDVAKRFLSDTGRWLARTGSTAVGEALQEGATTLTQLGLDKLTSATADSKELRDYANAQLPADVTALWEVTRDSMIAGAMGGGGVGGGMAGIQMVAERGRLAGDVLNKIDSQIKEEQDSLDADARLEEMIKEMEQRASMPKITDDLSRMQNLGYDPLVPEGTESPAAPPQVFPEPASQEAFLDLAKARVRMKDQNVPAPPSAVAPTAPAPAAPVAAPAPVPPTPRKKKTVTQKKADITDTKAFLDGIAKNLQSNRTGAPTNVNLPKVRDAIINQLGSGDANAAARLLTNGNVKLVSNANQIPSAELQPVGTAGFYDGNTTYVVADQLNPNNIIGDFLTIAAHEIKHGGDLAADPTLRTRMGELVGQKANARLNTQIEALAKSGNRNAIDAVAAARASGEYALELPAYFIQLARDSRDTGAKRVLNDTVSAVRTAYKRVMPGDYKVNLNDVAYLSDQLLKETVVNNPSLAMDPSQAPTFLQMIAGQRSTSFDQKEREGLVYRSRDGNLKYWMSDSESRIEPPANFLSGPGNNKRWVGTLGEVLKHDSLFEEYPQLRDYSVVVEDMKDKTLGSFNEAIKLIRMNKKLADRIDFNTPFHRVLLHEVQHAVQAIEGFDRGTSPEIELVTEPAYFKNQGLINVGKAELANLGLKIMQNDVSGVAAQLRLHDARNIPALDRIMSSVVAGHGKPSTDLEETYSAGAIVVAELAANESTRTLEVGRLLDLFNDITTAQNENNILEEKAEAKYRAKLGETEARFTEQNVDLTEDWMQMQPGAASINPELVYPETWSRKGKQGLASSVLPPRSQKIANDPKAIGEVRRAISRLLFPGRGFEPELEEIAGHLGSLSASLAVRGSQYTYELLHAIKAAAKRTKRSEEDIHAEIGRRMEAVDKLEDRDARRAAVAAIDRDFPGVGRSINYMRDYKLELGRELLALRIRDPKKLTTKEAAIYRKMEENAERYTTRAYLATYDKELGKAYGRHLLKAAKLDPNSSEGKTVQGAIDYLKNNQLVIPDREGLDALKVHELRRIFEAWIGDSSRLTKAKGRKAMTNQLLALPPRTQEQIDSKSMEIIRDMLGLSGNKASRLFVVPGIKQNRTILEGRTDIPEPLRKLLGEITDPVLRETISLQRMMNLVSKTKLLTEVYENGKQNDWWRDERTEAHQRQLNNVRYGPLDGKWINEDIEDALTGAILSLDNIDSSLSELIKQPDALMKIALGAVFKPAHAVMALQKTYNVVMSPFNMLANFSGALALMAPSQGIINPKTYWRGMMDTAQVLGREIRVGNTPNKTLEIIEELLFAGVTDSATMGEFRSEAFRSVHDQITNMIEDKSYTPVKMLKVLTKEFLGQGEVANGLRQLYAFMDVWVKVATYYDRKNFWTEMNSLDKMGLTEEQIIRRSGYEAAGTNIAYERSVPLVRAVERNIPAAMFLTYFSECFRATIMSYAQVVKDLNTAKNATNPKAKALAMKMATLRLIGTTAATVGVQQAVMAALDSEDEEERKKRQLDPDYMEDKWIIPMGLNEDGQEVMVEIQRIDSIGPFNEMMVAMQRAEPEERLNELARSVGDMFVESKGFLALAQIPWDASVSAVATAFDDPAIREWDANRQKSTIMERNYPQAYNWLRESLSAGDIGENFAAMVERLFLPSALAPLVDAERTQVSEVREGDATVHNVITGEDEPIHGFLRAAGYKAYTRDPETSMTFRAMDYEDEITRLRKERNDLNERAQYLDAADVLDNLLDIREQEREAFLNLSEAMEGYLAFEGNTYKGAMEIVGNKKLASRLRSGRFESDLLDGKALERWYEVAKKEKGADKQELREKYKLLRAMYKEAD